MAIQQDMPPHCPQSDPPAVVQEAEIVDVSTTLPGVTRDVIEELNKDRGGAESSLPALRPDPETITHDYRQDPVQTYNRLYGLEYGENIYPLAQKLIREFQKEFNTHPVSYLREYLTAKGTAELEREDLILTQTAGFQVRLPAEAEIRRLFELQVKLAGNPYNAQFREELIGLAVDRDAQVYWAVGYGRYPADRPLSATQKVLLAQRAADTSAIANGDYMRSLLNPNAAAASRQSGSPIRVREEARIIPEKEGVLVLMKFPLR